MILDNHNCDDGQHSNSNSIHPFLYAQILGIYHGNVIYIGEGMNDYQSRRMEFLWVRRYQCTAPNAGWLTQKLDRVQFLPMADDNTFCFIDPSDILRGSHIIPAFSQGKRHLDGIGLSHCARDANDYKVYYINR